MAEPDKLFQRLRARHVWFDHLVRALNRYIDHNAYQYAASITYFSVLSVVPIMMVGLSIGGFVVADDDQVANEVRRTITDALPSGLDSFATDVFTTVLEQRTSLGVFGLVIGLYAGWNWMNTLRDALTAMWDLERPDLPVIRTVLRDLLALLSLSAALVVSFGLSAAGGWLNSFLLRLVGLAHEPWAGTVLSVLSVPLAAGALLGVAQGWLISRKLLPSFVVTLCGALFVRGLLRFIASEGHETYVVPRTSGLLWVGGFTVVVVVVLYVVGGVVLQRTPFGLQVFAVGGSEDASTLMGVPVTRTKITVYVLSAVLASVAGVVSAGHLGMALTSSGLWMEVEVVLVVVIGGT
ncbi:YhjD/YihY/BrkB family envelope integrity protein, partial [Kibdelosporangium lantanae]